MSAARWLKVLGLATLAGAGPGAMPGVAQQPQVKIEAVFPSQVPRGQATVLEVAFPGRDLVVRSAEISPSSGVTVSNIKPVAESQGIAWWEVTVTVAADAALGNRSLLLVMPTGRTDPVTVTIPGHVPRISDFRIVSAQASQPMMELQFTVADESGDVGGSPYVWFTTGCGGPAEPLVGAVPGKRNGDVVRAAVPNPRPPGGGPPATACEIRVRATDSGGLESNTLKTVVDFKD